MATATLYERSEALAIITDWIHEHEDEIIAAGGELPPALATLLDEADIAFTEKAERVALYVRELLAEGAAIKEEEARLAARRKARERSAEGLKHYLHQHMTAHGIDKVKGVLCTVAIQASPAAVLSALSQEGLLTLRTVYPELVTEIPVSYRLDSRAVLERHKGGELAPFGVTVVHGTHLRIR